jgi:hypothetical protein
MKTSALISILTLFALPICALADSTEISLEMRPSESDNVFFPKEKKQIRAELNNPGETPLSAELKLHLELDNGSTRESTQTVELPAKGKQSVLLTLDLDEPCFADCTLTVNGQKTEARTTVAVVRPPQLDDIAFEQAFYGAHVMTNPATAKRVGIRFFRSIVYWKWTERAHGDYDFSSNVASASNALEHGVGYIWTIEPKLPDWIETEHMVLLNKPDSLELFRQWVHAAVSALPKERMAVEINNEPDITMGRTKIVSREEAVQSAADLLKTGYEVVKSIAPAIPVLGGGSSGSQAKPGGFAQQLLQATDGDVDYYSAHLYCNTRYVKPDGSVMWPDEYLVPMLEQNAKLAVEYTRKKILWSTELGWAYPMDDVYLSDTTKEYAAITAQALVLLKTVEHVGKIAWFRGFQYQLGLNERGYDYSLFVQQGGRNSLRPTTGVSAFATVSSLLEGSPTGSELNLGPAMRGYLFQNDATGQTIAALWTTHYDTSLKEDLPEGVSIMNLYGRELPQSDWKLARGPSFLVAPLEQAEALRSFLEGAHWRPEQPFILAELGANSVNEFRVKIESLLLEPVPAQISMGDARVETVLNPGVNEVLLPCDDGVIEGERLDLTLEVTGGEATLEVPVNKVLLAVPYADPDTVSPDKGITPAKQALATYHVDKKEYLFPPDPGIPWEGPEDLSISYGYAWNEDGLYAIYQVADDRIIPPANHGYWNFDSLQVVFDPLTLGGRAGYQPGQRELGAYLDEDGTVQISQGFPPRESKPNVTVHATQTRTGITYEWFIPWSYLYGSGREPDVGAVMGANFIVNDNDGSGRDCWMGLVDGIGENKKPDVYPWLYLEP